MPNIKLPLTIGEKSELRKHKVKLADIHRYTATDLEVLLGASPTRTRTISALAEFQTVPSVGIRFAEDLVFMGFYSIDELKGKNGAELTDAFERKKGYWIDPCVEDQFRLVVYYADTRDAEKSWWHFTTERKQFRALHGYPADRPVTPWYETLGYTTGRQ